MGLGCCGRARIIVALAGVGIFGGWAKLFTVIKRTPNPNEDK
jgi:hypothetical protein